MSAPVTIAIVGDHDPSAETHRATDASLDHAAAALGVDLVGVDLLPTGAGEYAVIELNGAVDFTSEYSLDEDVFSDAVAALLGSSEATDELEAAAGAEL